MKTAIQGLIYLCFSLLSVNTFAQTPDGSIPGCTDSEMCNFNSEATVDDGSCFPIIYGCLVNLPFICNFNPIANVDDNSCESSSCAGRATLRSFADAICVDPISENYFPLLDSITPSTEWATSYFNPDAANFQSAWVNQFYIDNSICDYIDGCTDQTAINYNPSATSDDDSCMPYVYGCIEIEYIEYNFNANVNDGSCLTPIVYGCTDSSAFNYNDDATTDDGSCVAIDCEYYNCCGVYNNFLEAFCPSELAVACSYNCAEVVIGGCTQVTACNYSEEPIVDDGSCTYPSTENLDCQGVCLNDTDGDGVCDEDEVDAECGDSVACNYSEIDATTDINNSLCTYPAPGFDCDYIDCENSMDDDLVYDPCYLEGCTDELACNFNVEASENDGTCEYTLCFGCMDASASNYDTSVFIDDGSCVYPIFGCTICGYEEYNPNAEVDDGSCSTEIILFGGCCCFNQFEISECGFLDCSTVYCSDQYYCNENGGAISYCPENNYLEYYFNPENWYDLINYDNPTNCSTPITSTGLTADMFTDPINTGANMTLPIPEGLLEQFAGGQIAAFMGDMCVGLESITTGFIAMGLWGDDSSTELIDGLLVGEVPTFAVLYNGGVISLDQNELTGYQTNGLVSIENFQFTEPIGCTDPDACNYLSYALIDDGSCYFADLYYNCEGSCINDVDSDGICDELEIPGCTVWGYNNYNELATDDDNSCTVSWEEDYAILSLSSTITLDSIQSAYNLLDSLPISIDLLLGWNIIGYTNSYEQDAEEALEAIEDLIVVFKDNNADVYLPEYGFNGIGNLLPGQGYQIKVSESYDAFSFENTPTFGCTYANTSNYNPNALIDDNSCIFLGCIDSLASNYVNYANQDDGTCIYLGCTSEWADNFDVIAVIDDASCYRVGCTINWADNYDSYATDNDGSCIRLGCTNSDSDNYDTQATSDDGSCYREGCMSNWADNYDVLATIDNASCYRYGCMNPDADNFDLLATINNNSCVFSLSIEDWGVETNVTDNNMSVVFPVGTLSDYDGGYLMVFNDVGIPIPVSYNNWSIAEDGSAVIAVAGTDALCSCDYAENGELLSFAILFNPETIVMVDVDPPVTYAANSFQMLDNEILTFTLLDGAVVVFGCTDASYLELDASANLDDGSCSVLVVEGCTDATADNFDAAANTEDGSCLFTGCMDAAADNYDSNANVYGYCQYLGCMDATACNFYASANEDDASCSGLIGCMDDNYYEFHPSATCDDGSCSSLIVPGCTDETAFNFNPSATEEDGSCMDIVVGCMNPSADNFDYGANTSDSESCSYAPPNPLGPNGEFLLVTTNSMSVIIQAGVTSTLDDFSDMEVGDILFAVYETSRLVNNWVEYSEVSGVQIAGAVVWNGGQLDIPVYGTENVYDNGFEEGENITWLVQKADGVIYNIQMKDAQGNPITISWEIGGLAIISGLTIGTPYFDGCTDATAPNFQPYANTNDGSCETPYSIGCMDEDALNFAGPGADPIYFNAENFGDVYGQNIGINLNTGYEFSSGIAANIHDQSFCQSQVLGCTNSVMFNYDTLATEDDGSCISVILGCLNSSALNYNELSNTDDGSCVY